MSSRIPNNIRWASHKKLEDLFDHPRAESLYGLFIKITNSPRIISQKCRIIKRYARKTLLFRTFRKRKKCLKKQGERQVFIFINKVDQLNAVFGKNAKINK